MAPDLARSPFGPLLEEIRERHVRLAAAPMGAAPRPPGPGPELHIEAGIVSGAGGREASPRSWRWPAAFAVHAAALAGVVLVPLMTPSELPAPAVGARVFVVPFVAAPPPPPAPRATSPTRPSPRQDSAVRRAVPPVPVAAAVAADVPAIVEPPAMAGGPKEPIPVLTADEGVPGGIEEGVPGGIVGGILEPSAREAPATPGRLHVGGEVKEPRKLKNVPPVYPDVASRAKVEGIVLLEIAIAPNGRVEDVRVLRSIPLLDEAAVTAARQWLFSPTLLGGIPVHVAMTVSVRFSLTQQAAAN
jgi:protein TonB